MHPQMIKSLEFPDIYLEEHPGKVRSTSYGTMDLTHTDWCLVRICSLMMSFVPPPFVIKSDNLPCTPAPSRLT